jgi:hypothetical protein
MKVAKLETLKDLIQQHKEFAVERFNNGDETAIIIGYSGTERMLFPLFYRNDKEKEMTLQIVSLGFIAHDVKRYTFDAQGYSLKFDKDEDYQKEYNKLKAEGKGIKDHPNHIEVLMCGAISHKEKLMQVFEISQNENKKELKGILEELQDVGGRFAELLPDPDLPKDLKQEIKAHFNIMRSKVPAIRIDPIQ